jgi:hypothetical protein
MQNVPSVEPVVSGYEAIKDKAFREALKKLGQVIAEAENEKA